MEVKKTYIVKTDIYDGQDVTKILFETVDNKFYLTTYIPGQVYELSEEQAKQLIKE